MKEVFPEFYINKNELNFRDLGKDVLVVFDTNILLDLYRTSSKLREELIKSIIMVKDNIWMPYQVGHEFHNKRKELMHEIQIDRNNFVKNLNEKFDKMIEDSINLFKNKYKLYEEIMENHKADFENTKASFKSGMQKMASEIKEKELVDYIDFLEEIFEGKVECNKEYEYEKWEQEAQIRYDALQPPGYKDYKEKKNQFTFINGIRLCKAYGDFFLWKEMLLKSKDDAIKEVVLITNDQKGDWVYETKGKKIGARMELVEEMMRESSASFRIYSTSSFLYHTSSQENYKSIEKEAIYLDEIKIGEIRKRLDANDLVLAIGGDNNRTDSHHFEKWSRYKDPLRKRIAESLTRIILLNDEFNEFISNGSDSYKVSEIENNIIDLTEQLLSLKDVVEIADELIRFKRYEMKIIRINKMIDRLEHELLLLKH